jgi:hypothetical protein
MPRYIVGSVTGYTIGASGKNQRPVVTYFVLDTQTAHREVAVAPPLAGGGNWPGMRKARMVELAARLNAEHEAWAHENGYPA